MTFFSRNSFVIIRIFNFKNPSPLRFDLTIRSNFSSKSNQGDSEIPKNIVDGTYTASLQSEKGVIYDKKPFRIALTPAKKYMWCACGHSKNQPFCDGTHKSPYLGIKMKPVRFEVEEGKDYWLCNCKQTSKRPFCDGTHKREDIQAKIK